MARASGHYPFKMRHKTDLISVIRGHHVYKSMWSSTIGEILFTAPDSREEAQQYDKYCVGVYRDEEHGVLVGHIPVEISSLCYHFLNQSEDNMIRVVVTGKRQREVGLVVPAKFSFETSRKKDAETLERELLKRKELFPTIKLILRRKGVYRKFPVYKK